MMPGFYAQKLTLALIIVKCDKRNNSGVTC